MTLPPLRGPPFLPETGTLLSLRDISPNRGITFQGRQEIHYPTYIFRQLVAPERGDVATSCCDRGVLGGIKPKGHGLLTRVPIILNFKSVLFFLVARLRPAPASFCKSPNKTFLIPFYNFSIASISLSTSSSFVAQLVQNLTTWLSPALHQYEYAKSSPSFFICSSVRMGNC